MPWSEQPQQPWYAAFEGIKPVRDNRPLVECLKGFPDGWITVHTSELRAISARITQLTAIVEQNALVAEPEDDNAED